MADNTTELEVLNQIVEVLGGQSGQYETVVPVLEDIRDLLGGGGGGGGYNPSLSVGRADALTGADGTAQWSQRTSEGSGSATVRSVQGAAVAWNQMCPSMSDSSWTEITAQTVTKAVTDEVMTLTFNGNGTSAGVRSNKGPKVISGHKYYIAYEACQNTTGAQAMVNLNGSAAWSVLASAESTAGSDWAHISGIFSINEDSPYSYICLYMKNVTSGSVKFRNVLCFDLTAMFGSGNEPSSVAEFEAMYPEAYYPYSAPTLKPVQIAGIHSTTAQGGELDSVEWPTQTLRAAGTIRDELTADELVTRVGVVDLGTLDWATYSTPETYVFRASLTSIVYLPATNDSNLPNAQIAGYTPKGWAPISSSDNKCFSLSNTTGAMRRVVIVDHDFSTTEAFSASVSGKLMFYALFNPTTTPISPALPMTYRVQQGGSESIIVPDGEISAAPLITLAEGESAAELVMDALACIATPDGPVATANHAINTYLTMGGKLYKVTRAIAAGETIAAGTNVTQTTVMAELIARTA